MMELSLYNDAFNIFQNVFTFFGTLDNGGIVTNIEGEIFEELKLKREIFMGQKFSAMVYRKSSKNNLDELESAIAEAAVKNVKSTFEFELNDDEKVFVELYLQPVFDKKNIPEYIFFGARNITTDESNYKEKSIDDRIIGYGSGDISQRKEKAAVELEEANRARDLFTATVSHELRSPLNTILGWTKILLTREVNENVRKSALETIEKSARLQAKLIDDLVDSTRLSSGKAQLKLRPTNLFDVMESVYNVQKSTVETKNVNLEFGSDEKNIPISGDAVRLQQIFSNLISNALKSTKAGENIIMSVQTGEFEVKIFVTDNGRGIDAETLSYIFQKPEPGTVKTSLNRTGLGLELSLVKILVEKHGGKVYAESEGVGRGSTFTVILPLSKTEPLNNSE